MKKIVTLQADKARNLKYGINGMIELEKELGKPFSALSTDEFTLADLRTMLYVGLKWEDKDLTHETVGEIMDIVIEENGMEYLSQKLGEAITNAFGNQSALPSKK